MRNQKKLILEQLERKLQPFYKGKEVSVPEKGWVHAIRTGLNMTLEQLGVKMNITKQGVKDMEERDAVGSLSIKSLKEVANVMDMQLVYCIVPKEESLDELVNHKARKLARKIVQRTNRNMKLENQGTADSHIEDAIEELAAEFKREMKKTIWD